MRALDLIVAVTLVVGGGYTLAHPRRMPDLPGPDQFDQTRAYVALVGAGTIAALDLRTNEVAWSLRVSSSKGKRPAATAMGIAASPDGRWVYTGDATNDEVVIVDADARRVAKRIPVAYTPHAIDVDESGDLLSRVPTRNRYSRSRCLPEQCSAA